MSQKNYFTAEFADVSLLSALYAKISVFGERMDNLNSRVNKIFGMVKRINTRLEDLAGASDLTKGKKMWFPEKSFHRYEVDFDLLIKSIEELNKLIRFEEQHIKHNPTGASFKLVEHIPLTLYEDGLVMSDGSLRPYSENKTKKIIEDLIDGFFPAELQHQYPEGVIFQVSDKRTELKRKCNTHEKKTTLRVEGVSIPPANPDKLLHKDSPTDVAFEGFPLLQNKFPRGKNEINVKILSHNGDKACTLQLSSTETKVGYLLRQLANGENARLLIGYPMKPLTEWNDSILDVQSTPTLAECGITENSLVRLQFQCKEKQ